MKSSNKLEKNTKISKRAILGLSLVALLFISAMFIFGSNKNDNESNKNSLNTDDVYSDDTNALYSDETKSFVIKTSYCDLKYPLEWKNMILIETNFNDKGEIVEFWANIEGKEKVHIFDIVFGDDGYELGTLETENNEVITVNVVSYDFKPDSTWNEEEKDKVYMMMEDINYILFQLEKNENYTPMH